MAHLEYEDRKDQVKSDIFHIRNKSMYSGSKDPVFRKKLLYKDNAFVVENISHSPTMYICGIEIISNAFDQLIKTWNAPDSVGGRVTDIKVKYEYPYITVYNSGKGYNVVKTKDLDGQEYWSPYLSLTKLRCGSNMDKRCEKKKSLSNNINGIGSSLTLYHSNYFRIMTYDKKEDLFYGQVFKCDLKDEDSPLIEGRPNFKRPDGFHGTEIKFIIDEGFLGYKEFNISDQGNFKAFLHAYVILLTFHIKSLGYTCNVYFNDSLILNVINYTHHEILKIDGLPFNIYLGTQMSFSMINNLVGIADPKSTHVDFVMKYLNNILKDEMVKFCEDNNLTKWNISKLKKAIPITISAQIYDLSPGSQTKDLIEFDVSQLSEFKLSNTCINLIKKTVLDHLKKDIVISQPKIKTLKPDYKKPSPNCKHFTLVITEGKHAKSSIDQILDYVGRDNYGLFDVRGLPTNSIRNSEITDEGQIILGPKFLKKDKSGAYNNKLLQLKNILQLEFGQTDFSKMKCKRVCLALDADADAIQITTMILMFFCRFWPDLYKNNFICEWVSPLVKITQKKKNTKNNIQKQLLDTVDKFEFYTEIEFEKYIASLMPNLNIDDIKSNFIKVFDVSYLKGLGSLNKDDMKRLSSTFEDNMLYFRLGRETSKIVNMFYSKNTKARKKFLLELGPKEDLNIIEKNGLKFISVTDFLLKETSFFYLLKISRALPSFIDGMNPSKRKILYCSIKSLNGVKPVAGFAGFIKVEMEYKHGEASLEGTLIGLGQSFKGANPVPLLEGEGNFGSLKEGIKEKIQPRYVKIKKHPLCDLIYKKEDLPLYEYNYDESRQVEPKYMIPVIPISILMNRCIPGVGWVSKIWSRNPFVVIEYIKKKISNEPLFSLWGKGYTPNMIINDKIGDSNLLKEYKTTKEYDPEYKESLIRAKIKSQEYELCIYQKTNNGYLVTELPTGIYIDSVIRHLDEKGIDAHDVSNEDNIGVEIRYKDSDFSDRLFEFNLGVYMDSHLNYLNETHNVRAFDSYEEVIDAWFPFRKNILEARLKREIECLEILILRLENILIFLRSNLFGLTKDSSDEDWENTLIKNNIVKLDLSVLDKNIKAVKDFALIYGSPSFNYIKKIHISKLSVDKINKYQKELENLINKLEAKRLETWESVMIKELDELNDALKKNINQVVNIKKTRKRKVKK